MRLARRSRTDKGMDRWNRHGTGSPSVVAEGPDSGVTWDLNSLTRSAGLGLRASRPRVDVSAALTLQGRRNRRETDVKAWPWYLSATRCRRADTWALQTRPRDALGVAIPCVPQRGRSGATRHHPHPIQARALHDRQADGWMDVRPTQVLLPAELGRSQAMTFVVRSR
jgi:hypothetical protein